MPPEDQKTQTSYASSCDGESRDVPAYTRPLESDGGQVSQGDPKAAWEARAKAQKWFKAVKEGLRRGDYRVEKHRATYQHVVASLAAGVPFREVMGIIAPAFEKKGSP